MKEQARKLGQRSSPLILIVTEGSDTEPNYFNALRTQWHLTSVKVRAADSSAPSHVVGTAIRLRDEAKQASRQGGFRAPFDEVWAVFDQDQHTTLTEALAQARREGVKVAFSKPCFEIWLILHFILSLKPMITADQVEEELGRHLPEYSKTMNLEGLVARAEEAVTNASKLEDRLKAPEMAAYPCTTVHHLVRSLANLRRNP